MAGINPRKRAAGQMGGVPACASFFEVANPSMEATNDEPSLTIPVAFIKRFNSYLSNMIKLEAPNGQVWTAHLEADSKQQLKIITGWKEFAHHMGVQSGDLIICDLVSKGHFQVYIYEGEDSCEKDLYNTKRVTRSSEKDIQSTRVPTLCTKETHTIGACNLHPYNHARKLCEKDTVTMEVPKLQASNHASHNNHGTYTKRQKKRHTLDDANAVSSKVLYSGHGTLTNNNDLLQLIQCNAYLPLIAKGEVCTHPNKNHLTLDGFWKVWQHFHKTTQVAFKEAIAYSSTNPFTILVMGHSNVCHGFKLALPRPFAKRYMSEGVEHVALLDSYNKAWTVTWLGHSNPNNAFSGGWKHFAIDHELKCGDICIFERALTKNSTTTFKVHILRVSSSDEAAIKDHIPAKFSQVITQEGRDNLLST